MADDPMLATTALLARVLGERCALIGGITELEAFARQEAANFRVDRRLEGWLTDPRL